MLLRASVTKYIPQPSLKHSVLQFPVSCFVLELYARAPHSSGRLSWKAGRMRMECGVAEGDRKLPTECLGLIQFIWCNKRDAEVGLWRSEFRPNLAVVDLSQESRSVRLGFLTYKLKIDTWPRSLRSISIQTLFDFILQFFSLILQMSSFF